MNTPSLSPRRVPRRPKTLGIIAGTATAAYLFLGVLVVSRFQGHVAVWSGLAFLAANLTITIVVCLMDSAGLFGQERPLLYAVYATYSLIYIAKAVIAQAGGLNTPYTFLTIRTILTEQSYYRMLTIVTVGNLLLAATFAGWAALLPQRLANTRRWLGGISRRQARGFGPAILVWIILSSVVMVRYNVGLMGAPGVSLPYKLSALLYYSRVTVIPLLLLHAFGVATASGNRRLLRATMWLYFSLTVSEIVVRTSKAPLIMALASILFLYLIMESRGWEVKIKPKRAVIAVLVLLVLATYPLFEAYQKAVLSTPETQRFRADDAAAMVASLDGEAIAEGLGDLFKRLGGFSQAAGLVQESKFRESPTSVMNQGGVARAYTQTHLGFTFEGHLSSPSLLGMSVMLGGQTFWFIPFVISVLLLLALWRVCSLFRRFELPLKAYIGWQAANTVIGGTIDSALFQIFLAICVGIGIELLDQRRHRQVHYQVASARLSL